MSWLAWIGISMVIGGCLGIAFMACLVMSKDADNRQGKAPQGAKEQRP